MPHIKLREHNVALSNHKPHLLHQTPILRREAKEASIEQNMREPTSFSMPDDPKVIFFPANQDSSWATACQDEASTKGEMGFNTFAFLSFALTIFNVMR